MRMRLVFLLWAIPLLLVGCASTVESRVARHKAEFDQLAPEVQRNVRAGRIEVGYSESAVRLALGEPSRRVERRAAEGVTEVWIYARRGPRFSFGFGVSGGSRHTAVGLGVDATMPRRAEVAEEAMRVEFLQGRVVQFEYRKG